MDIEIIEKLVPMKIPPTPQEIVSYLMMGDEAREDFNKYNRGYWIKHDESGDINNRGFFSLLRVSLHFNEAWLRVLQEESRLTEHKVNYKIIINKIKEFCNELYVGPMIGKLPYFKQWAVPYGQSEATR